MINTVSEVKILVVDDQPEVVDELSEFLQSSGYCCVPCLSSSQAIECFAADPAIGLVLCDLHMPECDGVELFRALKVIAGPHRLFEAIMLTGGDDKQDLIRALREGFADYYQKPVNLNELLEGVQRQEAALQQRQQSFQHLGDLNQKLQFLADSIDDLYQDLEKARGLGAQRRATDAEESIANDSLPSIFEKLSPRQLEVARLVSKGKTNYQIACELGITENTVKLYVSQVLRLTHMHNRTQLALALAPGNSPLHLRVTAH
ncbi:response regulator transcription factor [Pseudomonas sp. V1]|uniref:response regulator transcription factor n=1 Tax=Pseudomonas arcuscaelestis TaxID=2710591 RepID=UPI001940047E|nr:response regulator transcription factor [Pseudomonas arcuscaelestis]MBM3106527.1 response regulator transcription factor [Pseudomonas arcuscaelestis]